MSADNYLYVDRKAYRYVIVQRFASDEYDERVGPGEFIIADCTEPSSAVLLATRLQHEQSVEFGVRVSDRVSRKLGWYGPWRT